MATATATATATRGAGAWWIVIAGWMTPLFLAVIVKMWGFNVDLPPSFGWGLVLAWLGFVCILVARASRHTRAV